MRTPAEQERHGWQALSTDPAHAATFFREVLAEDVRMLLPGGLLLTDREQVIEAMSGAPWDFHEMSDVNTLHPGPDVALVTYRVEAERQGIAYSAFVASLYVRRSTGWRMVSHQHTPR